MAIEIKGLRKAFGRTAVLRGLNLAVPWGDVLTILGPNGSGKTTLISILATLTRPDSGVMRVAGLDATRLGHVVRRITGVVAHQPMLYDQLTGYENLKFAARMFGLDDIDERIIAVSAKLGLGARLQQRAGTLSHGMQKRVAIARALLHDPPLLLMDEPDSGLDQEAQGMLESVITDPTRPSRTVVMTTHNLERGLSLGRHLAVLSGGAISEQMALDSPASVAAAAAAYRRHTELAR